MSLAKAVANAAAMLVLKAKNVAQVAEDTVLQNRVIAAATQCALSTSQLVACAKVSQLAPLALSSKCHVLSFAPSHWGKTGRICLNCLRLRACLGVVSKVTRQDFGNNCPIVLSSQVLSPSPQALGHLSVSLPFLLENCHVSPLKFSVCHVYTRTPRVLALYKKAVQCHEWVCK